MPYYYNLADNGKAQVSLCDKQVQIYEHYVSYRL